MEFTGYLFGIVVKHDLCKIIAFFGMRVLKKDF
jgi:hypothetical protein